MFGSGVYNYVFIDRNCTDLLRYTWRSSPPADGIFSLLSRPPGPLVPGEVRSVGFDPGLRAPLLCDVVAPA